MEGQHGRGERHGIDSPMERFGVDGMMKRV